MVGRKPVMAARVPFTIEARGGCFDFVRLRVEMDQNMAGARRERVRRPAPARRRAHTHDALAWTGTTVFRE